MACTEQILNLLIGLGATEILIQIKKHEFRHTESQCPCHLSAYQLGYESLGAMTGTPEFKHILEAVVGRQRTALPERGDVAHHLLMS